MQIRSDIEKGIKYCAITVKEALEEYLKYQQNVLAKATLT